MSQGNVKSMSAVQLRHRIKASVSRVGRLNFVGSGKPAYVVISSISLLSPSLPRSKLRVGFMKLELELVSRWPLSVQEHWSVLLSSPKE